MDSKILKVPRAFTSEVYSGLSNETATCDWAPKLYISSGFNSPIILLIFPASDRSP